MECWSSPSIFTPKNITFLLLSSLSRSSPIKDITLLKGDGAPGALVVAVAIAGAGVGHASEAALSSAIVILAAASDLSSLAIRTTAADRDVSSVIILAVVSLVW